MNYKDFIKNYSKEIAISDMLNFLNRTKDSWETPNYLKVDPNNEKTDVVLHQKDQVHLAFSLDN